MDCQYGARRMANHLFGHGSEQDSPESGPPSGPDHAQIERLAIEGLDDLHPGNAADQLTGNVPRAVRTRDLNGGIDAALRFGHDLLCHSRWEHGLEGIR